MAETQTTGTLGTNGEDGNATATGTPPASTDGGNAAREAELAAEVERLKAAQAQSLAEKDGYERTKQENEALRAQLMANAGRGYQPPTAYDPGAQRAQQIAANFQDLQQRDPAAAELLLETDRLAQERIARVEAESRWYRELGFVPEADRGEVEREARTRQMYPTDAYAHVKARRWEQDSTKLADQKRKVQEEQDRLNRHVVRTTAEPAPSAPKADEITGDQYDQIIASARKGDKDARKKLDDVDAGKINVRYG